MFCLLFLQNSGKTKSRAHFKHWLMVLSKNKTRAHSFKKKLELKWMLSNLTGISHNDHNKTDALITPIPHASHRQCGRERDHETNGFRVLMNTKDLIKQISIRNGGQELLPRHHARRLIHGMTFDCEEWMLEIKLNELGNIIDHFILVEGKFTLQNTPRVQCFPSIMRTNERISKWEHKIVYIYDENPIVGFEYWEAEVYYRNLIGVAGLEKIRDLEQDDLVIVTDIDEMPHASFLEVLKTYDGFKTAVNLHMLWSYYSYKWVNPKSWSINAIVSIGELIRVGNQTNRVRFDLLSITDGWSTGPDMIVGWHCSWCMPTKRFFDKMAHFAHSELNQHRFRDELWLDNMRAQGLWFPDSAPNGCVQTQIQMPEYVRNNSHQFQVICM